MQPGSTMPGSTNSAGPERSVRGFAQRHDSGSIAIASVAVVSDAPPPPPPMRPGGPLPPPPPPGSQLAAPPGYVGYTPSPMSSITLKRVGAVGRAAQIVVAVAALGAVAAFVAGLAINDEAERYLDGDLSRSDFQTSILPYSLVGLVQAAATLASVVLVIIWMYRLASNHRTLHRNGRWGPGWAIGGWFLPPFLYVIPFLMFRELWKASDPAVPVGGEWRANRVSPVVTAWFVVYGPVSLIVQVLTASTTFNFSNSERALAEQIVDNSAMTGVAAAVGLVAGALFIAMTRALTDRHRRLIGEA